MIHPKARIIAEAGPIVIGEGNLIEEQALIINGSVGSRTGRSRVSPAPAALPAQPAWEWCPAGLVWDPSAAVLGWGLQRVGGVGVTSTQIPISALSDISLCLQLLKEQA